MFPKADIFSTSQDLTQANSLSRELPPSSKKSNCSHLPPLLGEVAVGPIVGGVRELVEAVVTLLPRHPVQHQEAYSMRQLLPIVQVSHQPLHSVLPLQLVTVYLEEPHRVGKEVQDCSNSQAR